MRALALRQHLCCVVADGAGGHGGGDRASKLAVQSILAAYAATPRSRPSAIERTILDTNRSIIAHRKDDRVQQNMHSTVVSLFMDLDVDTAAWGHCGDSRLYVFRDGRDRRAHARPQPGAVAGRRRPADRSGVRSHPQRSELLSALGVADEDLQVSVSEPPWQVRAGDVFLLCTDGLWEYVEDAQLEQALDGAVSPHAWLQALEQQVLAGASHKPSHDNFTALAVWVSEPGP